MQMLFDIDAIRQMVGAGDFARGEAYFREDRVEIVCLDEIDATARVAGTETYLVSVRRSLSPLEGTCTCPRATSVGVCKHMVATALTTNDLIADVLGPDKPMVFGAAERIRKHLKTRGVDTLVDMVLDIAKGDPALFDRLEMAATAADTDDPEIEKRLRKALSKATRYDFDVGAGTWANGVDSVLDAIAVLAERDPAPALRLIDQAMKRLAHALESIDDQHGECGHLLERARDIHLAATRLSKPDPVALARERFERELGDEWGPFRDSADIYADVLGATGIAAHRALAAEAWAKLPPISAGRKPSHDDEDRYGPVIRMLDTAAEEEDDIEARVALRTKVLRSTHNYFHLVSFCEEHGRYDEALHWAEEALFLFEDERTNEQLVLATVRLLGQAGRRDDALALLTRTFAKQPSLQAYRKLREIGGAAAAAAARKVLENKRGKHVGRLWQTTDSLLMDILIEEKMYTQAWSLLDTT